MTELIGHSELVSESHYFLNEILIFIRMTTSNQDLSLLHILITTKKDDLFFGHPVAYQLNFTNEFFLLRRVLLLEFPLLYH